MNKKIKGMLQAAGIIIVAGVIVSVAMRTEEVQINEARPTVAAENPQSGDIILYTELTGLIEPQTSASVLPKIGGEVLEVYFQSGDWVEAGQVLCKIDSDALTSLKLQMDAAALAVKEAAASLSRTGALYADGFVATQEMEQAENANQNARIAYETAKNQYELQVGYTTVTTPISGFVESRTVDPHDHIEAGTAIGVISGSEAIQVKFGITEKIRENLSLSDKITIEKNGSHYEAAVTEIGTAVNVSSGLYDVKAVVEESEGLTSGVRVKLNIIMNRAMDAMTVPVDAVDYEGGIPFVYCYENGVAHKTEIEAGIYDSEKLEVKSGLTKESQVITSWSNELRHMEAVLLEGEEPQEIAADVQSEKVKIND